MQVTARSAYGAQGQIHEAEEQRTKHCLRPVYRPTDDAVKLDTRLRVPSVTPPSSWCELAGAVKAPAHSYLHDGVSGSSQCTRSHQLLIFG